MIILMLIWGRVSNYRNSSVILVSRLAQTGKYIVTYIVWFQFCAAQLIAVVMLSNSISDEIYHKTLGVLITTPITSIQIVIGKLLSKLLQIILLLAISIPLLAIIRIFGGVPWNYIISSLSITLSSVLLISAVSLFYSIFCRKAYTVIIFTVVTFLVLFALFPFLFVTFIEITNLDSQIPHTLLNYIVIIPNPYIVFFFNYYSILNPGQIGVGISYSLITYVNSAISLISSFLLLIASIIIVRKTALRQASGQLRSYNKKKTLKTKYGSTGNIKNSNIISVIGPAVFWKEMILPLRKQFRLLRIIGTVLFMLTLFYSYWFFSRKDAIQQSGIQIIYSLIFMGLGTLFTIVISSVSITSEKESRSWPLLLTSTLTDSQIIIGKFYGIVSRCLPLWLLLIGHILFFYTVEYIHFVAVPLILILVSWLISFLCCTGMYFSSIFKHTTTAVIMNFILIALIWILFPLMITLMNFEMRDNLLGTYMSSNPFVQLVVLVESTIKSNAHEEFAQLRFYWPIGTRNFNETLIAFIISFTEYMSLGLILLWRTKKRIRRKIF